MTQEVTAKVVEPSAPALTTKRRSPMAAIMRNGVWQPLRVAFGGSKPSEARQAFAAASERMDEIQREYERVEAGLTFLREQTKEMEGRLAALDLARARAAAGAGELLAKMSKGSAL